MKITQNSRLLAVGAVSLALVAGTAASATAAVQPNGSDAPFYLTDPNTGDSIEQPAGRVFAWGEQITGSASPTDFLAEFNCSDDTFLPYTFVTKPGTEREGIDGWTSFAVNAFNPATGDVLMPAVSPENQILGSAATIKSTGGTYSMGIGCTNNNGLTVTGAYYRTIQVTPVTGAYTVDPVAAPVTPVDPTQSGSVDLNPSVITAVEGELSLTVPANAAAAFNAPTLVDNKSTTTGTLGNVTVTDERFTSLKGWTLNASVAEFARAGDPTDTIAAAQLGISPKFVGGNNGATLGTAQAAGSAASAYTFADAAPTKGIGSTVVNADLTFVAPQNKAAGTYNSKMTLTVVSK
jgi:uncharacterized membrane protein